MSKKWVIGAALVGSLALPAALRAHEGHTHRIMGTITLRHENHLEVKTKDGKVVTITLTDKTTYARGKQKVDDRVLQVGERVVIDVNGTKTLTAKSVKLGTAAATAKK